MAMQFKKANREQVKLRLALVGPAGGGKTYTALRLATALVGPKGRIAVIDSERDSAKKYAPAPGEQADPSKGTFEFEHLSLESFSPQTYAEAIRIAEDEGFDVVIIDSLSHAWMGKDGALDSVDKIAARSQSGNNFTAWRQVTPMHNEMVDTIIRCKAHVIATMRAKTEYVMEEDPRSKKKVPRKIGLAPVQRDGLEFEFDVVADMDIDNNMLVTKSRCPALSGEVFKKPGENVARILNEWLKGAKPAERTPPEFKPAEHKAPADPATISDEDAAALHKLVTESGGDPKRVCGHFKIEDFNQLTPKQAEALRKQATDRINANGKQEPQTQGA